MTVEHRKGVMSVVGISLDPREISSLEKDYEDLHEDCDLAEFNIPIGDKILIILVDIREELIEQVPICKLKKEGPSSSLKDTWDYDILSSNPDEISRLLNKEFYKYIFQDNYIYKYILNFLIKEKIIEENKFNELNIKDDLQIESIKIIDNNYLHFYLIPKTGSDLFTKLRKTYNGPTDDPIWRVTINISDLNASDENSNHPNIEFIE